MFVKQHVYGYVVVSSSDFSLLICFAFYWILFIVHMHHYDELMTKNVCMYLYSLFMLCVIKITMMQDPRCIMRIADVRH